MEALKPPSEQLAQLKDIHLPEQVHNYPVSYGWWLLLAFILIITILFIVKWQKHRKRCKNQKLAIAQLKITNDTDEIVTLLKWSAMQYFPRNEVASLHGEQLKKSLTEKLAVKYQEKFQALCGQQLQSKYQVIEKASAREDLKQAAHLWLSQALPPKTIKVAKEPQANPQGVQQ